MKNFILLLLISGFCIVLSNCSENKIDSRKLCLEFIELNKHNDFDGLYNISIEDIRLESIYNKKSKQYEYMFNAVDIYDFKTEEFFILPLFRKNSTIIEKKETYKKVSNKAKQYLSETYSISAESDIFDSFNNYVEIFYTNYDSIITPNWFGFKNVVFEGNPRLGKFITFILNEECKIYYLADANSLSEYWQKHFNRIKKYNDEWYYEITISLTPG